MSNKIMEAGFDHPCKQTCSGWQQGFERGAFDLEACQKRLEAAVRLLKVTNECFSDKADGMGEVALIENIDTFLSQIKDEGEK